MSDIQTSTVTAATTLLSICMTKLGSGIEPVALPTSGEIRKIRPLAVDPWEARYYLNDNPIRELMESIRTNGIQSPLPATILPACYSPRGTAYRLLGGYSTWICAVSLRMHELPVRIVELTEDESRGISQYANWSRLLDQVFNFRLEKWNYKIAHLRDVADKIHFKDEGRYRGWIKEKYLDEVARGCRSKRHLEYAARNAYFDIEPLKLSMTWWSEVLYLIVNAVRWSSPPEEPYAEMNAVYQSLADAVRAKHLYVKDGVAQLELLKHYRRFTRAVCNVAREVWPDVDFSSLAAQV